MKKLKYLSIMTLVFGAMAFACNDDGVRPLRGGEDEDEDPIVADPPTNPGGNTNPLDSLGV